MIAYIITVIVASNMANTKVIITTVFLLKGKNLASIKWGLKYAMNVLFSMAPAIDEHVSLFMVYGLERCKLPRLLYK